MTYLAFAPAFIDVDRMTPTGPSGRRLGARAAIVLAWLAVCAVWLVARMNGYWVR
jgi:hypothetical protein